MLITALAVALSFVAGASDLWRGRIPNLITYSGILAALIINAVGSLYEKYSSASNETLANLQAKIGWIGFGECVAGLAACGLILIVCYVSFPVVGGGDVKLLSMLGAMLGKHEGLEVLLWTFVLGACVAAIILIWHVGAWKLLRHLTLKIFSFFHLALPPLLSPEEQQLWITPLYKAPFAALAVILVRFGWGEQLLT